MIRRAQTYCWAASNPSTFFGNAGTNTPRICITPPIPATNGTVPIPNTQPISYAVACTPPTADSIFQATDDLIVPLPEDASLAPTDPRLLGYSQLPIGRPRNLNATPTASDNPLDHTGAYSWFLTVTPQPNNPVRFTVSVVVCFKRNLPAQPPAPPTPIGERAVTVTTFYDQQTVNNAQVAIGGGSIYLGPVPPNSLTAVCRPINDMSYDETASPPTVAGITIKENEWVALCNAFGLCRWYRVASVGDTNPTDTGQYLTLIGPDWPNPSPGQDRLVAVGQSVIGVYTATIDLDTDPAWKN